MNQKRVEYFGHWTQQDPVHGVRKMVRLFEKGFCGISVSGYFLKMFYDDVPKSHKNLLQKTETNLKADFLR